MWADEGLGIDEFIDSHAVSRFWRMVCLHRFFVAVRDCFDAARIGFVGPAIRARAQVSIQLS